MTAAHRRFVRVANRLVLLMALVSFVSACAQHHDELSDVRNESALLLAREVARMERRVEAREVFERDKHRLAQAIAEFPEAREELGPAYFDESTAEPEALPKPPPVGGLEGSREEELRVEIGQTQARIIEIRTRYTADLVKLEEQHARVRKALQRADALRAAQQ